VPPVKTPVSVVELPTVIVDAAEVKLVIAGAATTVRVAALVVAEFTELVNTARY
jgi:hypothetical protein